MYTALNNFEEIKFQTPMHYSFSTDSRTRQVFVRAKHPIARSLCSDCLPQLHQPPTQPDSGYVSWCQPFWWHSYQFAVPRVPTARFMQSFQPRWIPYAESGAFWKFSSSPLTQHVHQSQARESPFCATNRKWRHVSNTSVFFQKHWPPKCPSHVIR